MKYLFLSLVTIFACSTASAIAPCNPSPSGKVELTTVVTHEYSALEFHTMVSTLRSEAQKMGYSLYFEKGLLSRGESVRVTLLSDGRIQLQMETSGVEFGSATKFKIDLEALAKKLSNGSLKIVVYARDGEICS